MIVHLNGRLLPLQEAVISPLDRGFIFGEGVYEGLRCIAWHAEHEKARSTRVIGIERHIERLRRGLDGAGIRWDPTNLHELSCRLVEANGLRDAFVYWQISGGTPDVLRGHPPRSRVPPSELSPTVFGYCSVVPGLDEVERGGPPCKRVVTCRDPRWELGWLKSTSLMGNVWVARRAAEAGGDEAILIRGGDGTGVGGVVSEGLATNLVLVLSGEGGKQEIVTPSLDSAPMLAGVTRAIVLDMAPEIVERRVAAEELAMAQEVMMVGTTTYVTAITAIDGRPVGDGTPGRRSRELFERLMRWYREGRDQTACG